MIDNLSRTQVGLNKLRRGRKESSNKLVFNQDPNNAYLSSLVQEKNEKILSQQREIRKTAVAISRKNVKQMLDKNQPLLDKGLIEWMDDSESQKFNDGKEGEYQQQEILAQSSNSIENNQNLADLINSQTNKQGTGERKQVFRKGRNEREYIEDLRLSIMLLIDVLHFDTRNNLLHGITNWYDNDQNSGNFLNFGEEQEQEQDQFYQFNLGRSGIEDQGTSLGWNVKNRKNTRAQTKEKKNQQTNRSNHSIKLSTDRLNDNQLLLSQFDSGYPSRANSSLSNQQLPYSLAIPIETMYQDDDNEQDGGMQDDNKFLRMKQRDKLIGFGTDGKTVQAKQKEKEAQMKEDLMKKQNFVSPRTGKQKDKEEESLNQIVEKENNEKKEKEDDEQQEKEYEEYQIKGVQLTKSKNNTIYDEVDHAIESFSEGISDTWNTWIELQKRINTLTYYKQAIQEEAERKDRQESEIIKQLIDEGFDLNDDERREQELQHTIILTRQMESMLLELQFKINEKERERKQLELRYEEKINRLIEIAPPKDSLMQNKSGKGGKEDLNDYLVYEKDKLEDQMKRMFKRLQQKNNEIKQLFDQVKELGKDGRFQSLNDMAFGQYKDLPSGPTLKELGFDSENNSLSEFEYFFQQRKKVDKESQTILSQSIHNTFVEQMKKMMDMQKAGEGRMKRMNQNEQINDYGYSKQEFQKQERQKKDKEEREKMELIKRIDMEQKKKMDKL
ncbi:MAG: hypothetical protein EZS28_014061, partial [Streblomastix strix]